MGARRPVGGGKEQRKRLGEERVNENQTKGKGAERDSLRGSNGCRNAPT